MSESGKWWPRILLPAALAAGFLLLSGLLSSFVSLERTETETRAFLEQSVHEPTWGTDAGAPCWAAAAELTQADAPTHFAQGPDWRPESSLDTLFFRPGFVLRPAQEVTCDEGREGRRSWGYVRSRSPMPFFVRTRFGYFADDPAADDEDAGMAKEGVRTYFTFFGKTVLLNEWSTETTSE